ncbi:Transmembrane protein 94 [Nymphon striatum]|nr:Transmembrane protein 94 [Nymphon striatum]
MAVSVRGLSTKIALSILADRIIREIVVYKEEKKGSLSSLYWLKDSFHHANKKSILHWPSIVFILFAAAAAFICHFVEEENELKSSLAVEFFVLILLLSLNICVVGLDSYLRHNEIVTAIQNIVKKIKDSINDVQWKPENYPDLELPLSPAINLQWTYRDGSLVNLPWSLLVKGDVIVLHPGHKAPADCISYQADGNLADGVRLDRDEVYSPEIEGGGKEPINAPKARKPLPVQQFILIETPYIHNIRKFFNVSPEDVKKFDTDLRNRFEISTTIKGPLQFHRFVPLLPTHLSVYKLNAQVDLPVVVAITAQAEHDNISEVPLDIGEQNYVCCLYDNEPWIGLVEDISDEHGDYQSTMLQQCTEITLIVYKPIGCWQPSAFVYINALAVSKWTFSGRVIVLGVNIVRYFYWKTSMSTWTTSILLQPFHVVLPLLPLKFAICYTFLNLYGITRIIRFYYATEHGKIKPNLCDDGYCRDELLSVSKPTKRLSNFKFVKSLLFGQEIDEKFWLHRTSNIMHTLGSMTSLCCVDKKGLLSWPNPTAEKVFFFKNPSNTPDLSSNESLYQSSSSISQIEKQEPSKQLGHYGARLFPDDDHSVKTAPNYLENLTYPESKVEVLDITHNNRLPFALQFDDSHWKQYLNSLKPLGLNILLNTCNAKSQPQYINFCSHLAREALSNEISVSVINRRCLCELSKQIGFVDHASEIFQFEQQLSFYRHVQEDIVRKDKLTRSLDVKKLKCAIPNAVSIVTRDTITGTPQLMSQGTADILIDLCSDYWDGNDIIPITQAEKKKILDFYHRNSLTAYCSAFAYRPITSPMSDQFSSVYVELPPDYYQLFHHSFSSTQIRSWEPIGKNNRLKNIHYLSSDSIFLHESSDQYSNDPEILLQPVCNQIFIGMVAMQYQARSDIVRLIEQLDEACIRFVHFSKENELRSRVFSEKMGLESGWNCHISLLGDKVGSQKSIFKQNMTSDISKKVSQSSIVKKEEITVENKLLSADLTKRFHRSHSAPVAVHYEFDAIQFSNSSSLENSFQNHTEKSSRDVSVLAHSPTPSLECDVPFDSVNEHSQLLAGEGIQLRVSDVDNDTVAVLSLNETSETDSSDGGPVAFDMSNRAKLPKGIENIRPHLENIDNVPLLVSLFTDCTPDTTCEMIEIMQEHNEIICCIGSIANFHNMSVFLKSDVSIGVIPLYPQICMKKSVIENELPQSVMSPTKMGSMLNSFSCALTYHRDDPVDLYELIKEARHYLSTLKNSFRVMLYCCMTVTLLQLFAIFLLLPPILTGCQILWLTCVVIPVVSISTMASPSDSRIMFLATNKIVQKFDKQEFNSCQLQMQMLGMRFLSRKEFTTQQLISQLKHNLNGKTLLFSLVFYVVRVGWNAMMMWYTSITYTTNSAACIVKFNIPAKRKFVTNFFFHILISLYVTHYHKSNLSAHMIQIDKIIIIIKIGSGPN